MQKTTIMSITTFERLGNLIDYLTFMLNKNADIYGYCVDYNADWNTNKQYIKDIFEGEMGIWDTDAYTYDELRMVFLEWITDYHCMMNVFENLDYSDNYKLEYFVPKSIAKRNDQIKLDYVNNQIFALLYA